MGLKGAVPYFQRSMSSTVLAGLVIHGSSEREFLANVRTVFTRLREFNITVNPKKTRLGLAHVEYVGHLLSSSSQGISFTEAKRLKVLDFPRPLTEKQLLMFIGLVNYFRDHVPHMTELMKPLRDMHHPKSYKPSA